MAKKPRRQIEEVRVLEDFFRELPSSPKGKWIFRGEDYFEGKKDDVLKTTLEKSFERFGLKGRQTKRKAERDVIREFQRKLHLYMDCLPTRADVIQWLAIMQHHGAPTRLLDWTYSFWIAVHFATVRRKPGDCVTVWAVNTQKIGVKQKKLVKKARQEQQTHRRIIRQADIPYADSVAVEDNVLIHHLLYGNNAELGVYAAAGFRLNQRITIQQGTFLIPGDIEKSFYRNLSKTVGEENIKQFSFVIGNGLRAEITENLRQMNISNAVLFPGLEGFSESLWLRVGLPVQSFHHDVPLWP